VPVIFQLEGEQGPRRGIHSHRTTARREDADKEAESDQEPTA